MKRSVASQNFCRLSERHASPGGLDKQCTVLQKLLSWVYWLSVRQSSCQLLPPVFILFFIFNITANYQTLPYHLAFKLEAVGLWSVRWRRPGNAGHAGFVCEWQLGDLPLGSIGGLLAQVLVCLKSRGMWQTLLVMSSDEILTDFILCTALTALWPVASQQTPQPSHLWNGNDTYTLQNGLED